MVPWRKTIKHTFIRRFEILGLPLHLVNELTIHKIGSCIGEVVEVHHVRYNFESAEVSVILNDDRECQKSIRVKEGLNEYKVWIDEIQGI